MKPTQTMMILSRFSIFLLLFATLLACSKDSDSNSVTSTSSSSSASKVSLSGTYTGTQTEVYTATSSGNEVFRDVNPNHIFTISGSGENYVMEFVDPNDQSRSTINLSYKSNSISGSGSNDPNDYFEGETYSGSLSGDQLTLQYTGTYDVDTTYTGTFIGNRPPSGGGSGGGANTSDDFITISGGYTVGNRSSANCDEFSAFTANFDGPNAGEYWWLSIDGPGWCSTLSDGNYNVVAVGSSFNSGEVQVKLYLSDSNGSITELDSKDNGGSVNLNTVGSQKVFSGSNLPFEIDGNQGTVNVSFKVTSDL